MRKQAPEKAESRSRRAPTPGLMMPAEARKTISSFSASAIASPSAPVIATARSATSCSTSSRTNCSPASNSAVGESVSKPACRRARARRRRTCSCSAEKASKACKASRPEGREPVKSSALVASPDQDGVSSTELEATLMPVNLASGPIVALVGVVAIAVVRVNT